MDLENYELYIKRGLVKRRIAPSNESWNRLETMLVVEEETSRKSYWWIAIAASFLLGFFVVKSIVVNNTKGIKEASLVLVSKDSCINKSNPKPLLSTEEKKIDSTLNFRNKYNNNNKMAPRPDFKEDRRESINKMDTPESKEVYHHNEIELAENKESRIDPLSTDPKIENILRNETSIAKAEAITRLHKSKLELEAQIILKKSNNTVNSTQLLNEVENGIQRDQEDEESIHQRVAHFVKIKFVDKVNSVFVKR